MSCRPCRKIMPSGFKVSLEFRLCHCDSIGCDGVIGDLGQNGPIYDFDDEGCILCLYRKAFIINELFEFVCGWYDLGEKVCRG